MEITVSKRCEKIIKILLLEKNFLSASELANLLHSSEKTIKNEIRTFNSLFPKHMITSKKGKGYILENKEEWRAINIHSEQEENRDIRILKRIIMDESVDYYELADYFFISTSTLNKDILQLNRKIHKEFKNIKISRKNNILSLDCDGETKRRILTFFLIEEGEKTDLDMHVFEKYFENCDILKLSQIITDYVHENDLHLSDYNIYFILLHILVLISNDTSTARTLEAIDDGDEFTAFIAKIEACLSTCFTDVSIMQIRHLLNDRSATQDENTDIFMFVNEVFDEIYEVYNINFCGDEELKQNLSLHLCNLRQRCKNKKLIKNPLLFQVKQKFVLVYDIAAFIALRFKESTKYDLDEHEISFIALHVLNGIKHIKGNNIRVAIINPYGKSISNVVEEQLEKIHDVEVIGNFSAFDYNALYKANPELIISLIQHDYLSKFKIFKLNNYLREKEYEELGKLVKDMKVEKNYQNIIIQNYFHKELFTVFHNSMEKNDIIDYLCHKLLNHGYVDDSFKDFIYEREQVAPTCFGAPFAIPHTTKKVALKSGIAVALFEKPILWDGSQINAVFMFALDKNFNQIPKLYDVLLAVFDNSKRFNKLCEAKSFQDLINQIIL